MAASLAFWLVPAFVGVALLTLCVSKKNKKKPQQRRDDGRVDLEDAPNESSRTLVSTTLSTTSTRTGGVGVPGSRPMSAAVSRSEIVGGGSKEICDLRRIACCRGFHYEVHSAV